MTSETTAALWAVGLTAGLYFVIEPPNWGLVLCYGVIWNMLHSYIAKEEIKELIIKATM